MPVKDLGDEAADMIVDFKSEPDSRIRCFLLLQCLLKVSSRQPVLPGGVRWTQTTAKPLHMRSPISPRVYCGTLTSVFTQTSMLIN